MEPAPNIGILAEWQVIALAVGVLALGLFVHWWFSKKASTKKHV